MTVRISSLCAQSSGEEICVGFELESDGGEHTERVKKVISSKQYLVLGLCKGECTTEVFDAVSEAAEDLKAQKRGISLLGYGACSKQALVTKLRSKGFERERARRAAEEICARGLLDGRRDAMREAQRCADKLWGERRICAALCQKGYAREDIEAALLSLEDGGIDYVENCRRLIAKRFGKLPEDKTERQRAIAAIARYGYSLTEIRAATQN